jgi:hypothetical protein
MSLTCTSYHNTGSIDGGAKSTFVFICDWADRFTNKALLLGAVDANDTTLMCNEVTFSYLGNQHSANAELHCSFIPAWKILVMQPDNPFLAKTAAGAESFTISGDGWTWASGDPILNKAVLPIKTVAVTEVVLFGCRSAEFSLDAYDGYEDKVNDGEFLGAPAGTVMFQGATRNPRYDCNGNIVYDVEIKLKRRNKSWNEFFNETTGHFEEIKDGSGNKAFESTSFAGLLE